MKYLILFFALIITACSSVEPSKLHDEHDHGIRQFNPKVLNCVGPSGYHVYKESTVCPLGGEKFTALYLGTHSTMGQYLDWQSISYMRFPVAIPVCPKNGFIIDQEKYTNEELAKRKTYIESAEYQKLYKENHSTFFLFAKQSEALKENLDSIYWYYLKATWEADGCGNQERYNQYANLVIEKAIDRKSQLTENDEEYWGIEIIIAEMYRRTGQFSKAQEQLNAIGTPSLKDVKSNEFYLLAKRLMQIAINEKSMERVPIRDPEKN